MIDSPAPISRAVPDTGTVRQTGLARQLLDACVAHSASDLHINPGSPPVARIQGRMAPLGEAVWGADATEAFCRSICTDHQWAEVESTGTVDFGISHASGDRFRANVLRQRNGYGAVLRRIADDLVDLDKLGLPPAITDLLRKPRGLILVTGPTGSGKSTTLAAMVDWINTNLDHHIVTIEDPVEFQHRHKKSLITQREVGTDVPDFPEAMRRVLRQDPDVILVGEMRDLETISAAVSAAETGHLVLGTLHTTGSATTVSRIIDVFPVGQQAQIRVQLAMSLAAVISQLLVPVKVPEGSEPGSAGRVAAFEIMVMTPAIANLIRNNEINRINDVIQTSRHLGMIRLDDHLGRLVEERRIDRAVAVAMAQDAQALGQRLGG